MVSFLANPERSATAPDGTAWHIRLVRGNAWPGWRWTRRTENWNLFGSGNHGDLLVVVILALVVLAEGPPTLWRWCVYRFQRRRDWRVLVWRGPDALDPRRAVADERCSDKASAAARATELLTSIRAGVGVDVAAPRSAPDDRSGT